MALSTLAICSIGQAVAASSIAASISGRCRSTPATSSREYDSSTGTFALPSLRSSETVASCPTRSRSNSASKAMTLARRRCAVTTFLDDILDSHVDGLNRESDERFQRLRDARLNSPAGLNDVRAALDNQINIDDHLLLSNLYFHGVIRTQSGSTVLRTPGFTD